METIKVMRTRKTNVYQIILLITAFIYFIGGVVFFTSPFLMAKVINIQTNDEWLNQIRLDEFLVLIYIIARSLSALLALTGLSLVMPLYDPLKYRFLSYLLTVYFPLIMSCFLIYSGFSYGYNTSMIIGVVFGIICVANYLALLLTKANAKKGIE